MEYFRFIVNGEGIYQAISKESSLDDPRRLQKPDGSWLPKEGTKYPGAVSFWTEFGLKKYFDSGLLNWHASIVKENVDVVIIENPTNILHEDQYQIILMPGQWKIKDELPLDHFLKEKKINSFEKDGFTIVIENPKGSYKSFEIEGDLVWKDYPLAGVTYPVNYGYLEGYKSEDNEDLDVFVGSGDLNGYIKIWRYDVPIETKFILSVTEKEWEEIIETFKPVIKEELQFNYEKDFRDSLDKYKR